MHGKQSSKLCGTFVIQHHSQTSTVALLERVREAEEERSARARSKELNCSQVFHYRKHEFRDRLNTKPESVRGMVAVAAAIQQEPKLATEQNWRTALIGKQASKQSRAELVTDPERMSGGPSFFAFHTV